MQDQRLEHQYLLEMKYNSLCESQNKGSKQVKYNLQTSLIFFFIFKTTATLNFYFYIQLHPGPFFSLLRVLLLIVQEALPFLCVFGVHVEAVSILTKCFANLINSLA